MALYTMSKYAQVVFASENKIPRFRRQVYYHFVHCLKRIHAG